MNTSNRYGLTDYAALLLRLSLGAMYLTHAQLKTFTFTLPGAAAFFEKVGFAGWMVYPVVAAEVVGGLLLILGIKSRWVALALVPILAAPPGATAGCSPPPAAAGSTRYS